MATRDERRGRPRAQPRSGANRPKRPLPPGERFFTPGATGLRKAVEQRSAAPMAFLFTQVPRWVVPVVMVVLLLTGFAVQNWLGGLAVLPVLAFVAWLAYLSWPSLKPGGKLMRVAMLTFLALMAAAKFGAFYGSSV
ncbi:DUF6703 family protein [Thermoactinospora rubra]|uniref:DUF6703 family protein n=1 Tax=Thermoactinospora rubra TaxID=1088767 RepID=UPI000A10F2E3|nr:DUF6703 family protein [Thermoactinospora rubra]